jgi:predicted nuclease with TOPRIM domain
VDLGSLAASVVTSVGIVFAGWSVARRFQKLGGDVAQERLNKIRAELDAAMAEKVSFLEEQFVGCKKRLIEVEDQLKRMRGERIELKQEVADLHAELRTMRGDRKGRADRAGD